VLIQIRCFNTLPKHETAKNLSQLPTLTHTIYYFKHQINNTAYVKTHDNVSWLPDIQEVVKQNKGDTYSGNRRLGTVLDARQLSVDITSKQTGLKLRHTNNVTTPR